MFRLCKKGAFVGAVLPVGLLVSACGGMGYAGVQDVKAGHYQAAEADFSSDYSGSPGHPLAVFNMGVTLHHEGKLEEADAKFREAAAIGRRYHPDEFLEPDADGRTVSEIACRHLHDDRQLDADCGDQIVAVIPAPAAPIAEAQPVAPEPAPVEAEATTPPPQPAKQDRN
jgi:hypothetical protein